MADPAEEDWPDMDWPGRDWKARMEIDRREIETFRRLHRLYKKGFRPDWSVTVVEDAVWWIHPGGYPNLVLYPDGKLVAINGRATLAPNSKHDQDRIYNTAESDDAQFDRWLTSVKPPTWWQAGRYARERYIWVPTTIVAINGLGLLLGWVVMSFGKAIWRAIAG